MKHKVQTRETSTGRYWCNATINGYDVSVEDDSAILARKKFKEDTGLTEADIEWLPVKGYQHKPDTKMSPNLITSQKVRLDHDPQG